MSGKNKQSTASNSKLSNQKAAAALVSATSAASGLGSVTVATITTTAPAWGPLGWVGLTTTATTAVALPIAGVVAVGGALVWGGLKVHEALKAD